MKFPIFKNPVILSIFINTIYLILLVYSIRGREKESWLAVAIAMSILIVGGINRQIIGKEQNIKKKIAIWISFFSMTTIALLYSIFM